MAEVIYERDVSRDARYLSRSTEANKMKENAAAYVPWVPPTAEALQRQVRRHDCPEEGEPLTTLRSQLPVPRRIARPRISLESEPKTRSRDPRTREQRNCERGSNSLDLELNLKRQNDGNNDRSEDTSGDRPSVESTGASVDSQQVGIQTQTDDEARQGRHCKTKNKIK